ncbi:cytochrome P450 [Amycolatopsis suaedae]|uniref:Cytochrome P450 n=1 Tax=Amycolatopsis suaedae TaxID=2510978 RepID=A0A4Q7J0D7_9PSEU|nr:cytochrome P450 [Amycolatopsis suaedae]RZQ60259.1 cytochrome P450 [Amycolatopsis suaedae]
MTNPFTSTTFRLGDHRATARGPALRREESPAGGPVWVIADNDLARRAINDRRITKDTAFAPAHWRTWENGLEPPGGQQPSLTTLDGEEHLRLRRAHTPLFTARRLREHTGRMAELARTLLGAAGPDLAADFTMRYPLSVICHVLGVPAEHLDAVTAALRGMTTGTGEDIWRGTVELTRLTATALHVPDSGAAELRSRLPADLTDEQVGYLLFGLVMAGQITTEATLGFLIAHHLAGHQGDTDDETFVRDVVRRHSPAPFTLWRFTTEEIELDGQTLPPRSPVLAHIQGINDAGDDLTFGAGAHYCVGAQLAQLELVTLLRILRTDFPAARLEMPFDELPVHQAGVNGVRLTRLPVTLR